jgi:hypothetical protein
MSSTKKVIGPFKSIDNGSMAGNLTSAATVVRSMDMLTFFIEWDGAAPVGSISFDYVENESLNPSLELWKTIDLGPAVGTYIPVSGNTGSHTVIFSIVPFVKIRCNYTRSSGTGNLTVTITGKEG